MLPKTWRKVKVPSVAAKIADMLRVLGKRRPWNLLQDANMIMWHVWNKCPASGSLAFSSFLKRIFAFRALDSLENFSQLVSVWTGATQFYGSLFRIEGESLKSLFHLIMFNMIWGSAWYVLCAQQALSRKKISWWELRVRQMRDKPSRGMNPFAVAIFLKPGYGKFLRLKKYCS